MDGVLNINKPAGPTSHDIVAWIRRATGMSRIGHAGTLDPMASGVLVLCVGNATRIAEYLMDTRKVYRASAVFGIETDTEDSTGSVLQEKDCPRLTREGLESALREFTGRISQIPPMVSAVHHEGKRLYELARMGKTVERQPRTVEIFSLRLLDFVPGEKPIAEFEVACSSGTYIRTLCADIGRAVDCGAHMSSLVRTAVGRFGIEDALTIEDLEKAASEGRMEDLLCSMDDALADMARVTVSEEDVRRVANGMAVSGESLRRLNERLPEPGIPVRMHTSGGGLLGIGRLVAGKEGESLQPEKVFVK